MRPAYQPASVRDGELLFNLVVLKPLPLRQWRRLCLLGPPNDAIEDWCCLSA